MYDCETVARFWEKVDRKDEEECWEWTATTTKRYGRLKLKSGLTKGAHVISYEIHHGPTGGLFVCHSCDNPPCCNPKHLWLGSNKDNMKDAKRRILPPVIGSGSKNGNAKLVENDVVQIKQLILDGRGNTEIFK